LLFLGYLVGITAMLLKSTKDASLMQGGYIELAEEDKKKFDIQAFRKTNSIRFLQFLPRLLLSRDPSLKDEIQKLRGRPFLLKAYRGILDGLPPGSIPDEPAARMRYIVDSFRDFANIFPKPEVPILRELTSDD
jgi:hypothetical protein